MPKNGGMEKASAIVSTYTGVIVIISAIIGATLYVASNMAVVRTTISYHQEQLSRLGVFMEQGERCTREQCDDFNTRLKFIEKWIMEAPPDDFENMVSDFKVETRKRMENHEVRLDLIRDNIRELETKLRIHEVMKGLDFPTPSP